MEVSPAPVSPDKARKRKRNPTTWQCNIKKKLRYSSKSLPQYPKCGHTSGAYQCQCLTMKEIKDFHQSFFASKNKLMQDAFLLKYCIVKPCKRRRAKNNTHAPKTTTVHCFIRNSSREEVPVCQASFLQILGITKHRLSYVMRHFNETGQAPVENRGGDHKTHKFIEKQQAVQYFITRFKCIESDYCRSTTRRMYLPSDLTINKMHKMYNEAAVNELKVKRSYFRLIFNTKFNLSFKTPRTDVCSTCLELAERIKRSSNEEDTKNLTTEMKIHKLRAGAFFDLLREERDDLIILSFDCQKNLVLPKVPDQAAYYSRQLYLYNFTIVQGTSKTEFTKENVFAYYWTENEFAKGSNEISSAVYHRLKQLDLGQTPKTIRLVADGCSGQNKNTILIGMCCKWLADEAPPNVENIEIVFPVVGHSFSPADRVFGHIEKNIRKLEVIAEPQKYVEIFSEIESITQLGEDCKVLNWKDAAQEVLKQPGSWHFKFKQSKRFFLKRCRSGNILIRGELHYKNDLGMYRGITKKGKTPGSINPEQIEKGQAVKEKKLKVVNKLLTKHFGKNWREFRDFTFYNNIVHGITEEEENPAIVAEENTASCEYIPELPSILV